MKKVFVIPIGKVQKKDGKYYKESGEEVFLDVYTKRRINAGELTLIKNQPSSKKKGDK
jgi:hypothetical protein